MTYNWLEHWESGNIAFHQSAVNPGLEKYWPVLALEKPSYILVPLCGKTLDMLWLAHQGYHVIGVELSEIACRNFFTENKLSFTIQKHGKFTRYSHIEHQKIEIYCGDFFDLSSEILPIISGVYDRAALIALPEELRKRYTKHLCQLLSRNSQMLLVAYDSPNTVQGPPYPVSFDEIKKLFKSSFQINQLERHQKADISKHLYDKNYREIYEAIYHLVF